VLTAGLVHAAERALPSIPTPLASPLAETIGTLAWAASPATRGAVRANLAVIAPERATSATVRRVFVEQAHNYLEIFRIPRLGAATIRAMDAASSSRRRTSGRSRSSGRSSRRMGTPWYSRSRPSTLSSSAP
jgi:hypothetical protein